MINENGAAGGKISPISHSTDVYVNKNIFLYVHFQISS
jgi:hypothetical protein